MFNASDADAFYENYYRTQVGGAISVFHGRRVMGGDGLGSLLSGGFRRLLPAMRQVGKRMLESASGVASDVLDGQDFASSTKKHLKLGGKNLLTDVKRALAPTKGKNESVQSGSGSRGKKRKRKASKGKKASGRVKRRKTATVRDIFR
jgi:hypothetical protein